MIQSERKKYPLAHQMLSSSAVFAVNAAVSFTTLFTETTGLKSFLEFSRDGSAQRTQLTSSPTVLYLRRDRTDRHHIAKVYDAAGVEIYTIERRTMFTPVWSVLTVGDKREIATLHAGLMNRYFDFNCKPEIRHRNVILNFSATKVSRQFYLNDGAGYEWRNGSKYLERIVNPGSGDEEIRQRVAKVRQMRTMRFDFEILVDESMVDLEVALVTAYITMLTQWGIGSYVDTRGPTKVQHNSLPIFGVPYEPETHVVELTYDGESTDSIRGEPISDAGMEGSERLLLENGKGPSNMYKVSTDNDFHGVFQVQNRQEQILD